MQLQIVIRQDRRVVRTAIGFTLAPQSQNRYVWNVIITASCVTLEPVS